MGKFEIRYGLGGSFGGTKHKDWEEIEAKDLDDAENEAYLAACQEWESYEGLYGLRGVVEIMEDEDLPEEEAEEIWREEREGWLAYEARPAGEMKESEK